MTVTLAFVLSLFLALSPAQSQPCDGVHLTVYLCVAIDEVPTSLTFSTVRKAGNCLILNGLSPRQGNEFWGSLVFPNDVSFIPVEMWTRNNYPVDTDLYLRRCADILFSGEILFWICSWRL